MLILILLICLFSASKEDDASCNINIKEISYLGFKQRPSVCNETQPCILKCCDRDEVLLDVGIDKKCIKKDTITNFNGSWDYTNIKFYATNEMKESKNVSDMNWSDVNVFYSKNFMNCTLLANLFIFDVPHVDFYVMEDLTAVIQLGKYGFFYINKPLGFCVDIVVNENATKYDKMLIFINDVEDEAAACDVFLNISMSISIFFFFLTITIQVKRRQYEKMVDKLMFTYIVMLFAAYVWRVVVLELFQDSSCLYTTPVFFFLFLSSIFWINVISWDIWWTFRGMKLKRQIHRRGINSKYKRYALYAWGVPLLLTITAVLIDIFADNNVAKPSFDRCFTGKYEDTIALVYYMYIPILILIISNCCLFGMTVYNIYIAAFKGLRTKVEEHRFVRFMKLFSLMGVSWILEVIELITDSQCTVTFYIQSLYNALIGVIIFLLFTLRSSDVKKCLKLFKRKDNQCSRADTVTSGRNESTNSRREFSTDSSLI